MRFNFEDKFKNKNVVSLLRGAGYRQEFNRKTGQTSYSRSLSGNEFPRFHIYTEEMPEGWEINLHLDQKAPSYGGAAAHGGEYAGETVEAEARRLMQILK